MADSPARDDAPALDGVSRLLIAAATAALAISAQRWAVDDFASASLLSPVQVAAIVGFSAVLASARLPLLVRVAIHLGALWLLQQTLGDGADGRWCGLFFVSTAAFVGGLAVAGLSNSFDRRSPSENPRRNLTTGDLLATLFAFSAYVAVGQHEASAFGPGTLPVLELAIVYVLMPYAVLIVAELLIGRGLAAVAVCLAAVVSLLVVPNLDLIDPFATALIVAFRIVSRPQAAPFQAEVAPSARSLA